MSVKLQEAQEHYKQAEKYLKTTMFRWRPDYESAANEFTQAAQAYRVARDIKNAKKCFLKAGENFKRINSLFYAAKSIDNALSISKESCSPKEIFNMASESANLYRENGSVDSAAVVLDRAAKFLEAPAPRVAVKLYMQAVDVTTGDTNQSCGEYLAKTSKLLVRLKRFDEAADSITREILFYQEVKYMTPVGRLTVALILVQLARGDVVSAWKAYEEWGVNCESSEAQTLVQLLQAFDDEDAETARGALMSSFIRGMDVDYVRLAETIPLPETTKPVAVASAAATSAASAAASTAETIVPAVSPCVSVKSVHEHHESAPYEAAPCMLKPKETIKEPELDEIHEDERELC